MRISDCICIQMDGKIYGASLFSFTTIESRFVNNKRIQVTKPFINNNINKWVILNEEQRMP